jgi:hypothetical protein
MKMQKQDSRMGAVKINGQWHKCTTVGKYNVIKTLGSGATAKVKLG